MGEDFAEDFVVADFAGYFAKVVQTFPDVLAHEVPAQSRFQACYAASERFIGTHKSLVVARICHHHSVVINLRYGSSL